MGGERVTQELLSGLNMYNPARGVQYAHIVSVLQVAIHASPVKYPADHTAAGKEQLNSVCSMSCWETGEDIYLKTEGFCSVS